MINCAVNNSCYAMHQAKRAKKRCILCYEFKPHYHTERYLEPTLRKLPCGIFVCSMGEIFDDNNGWGMIAPILNVIERCPQHIFYILTKQPQNAKNWPKFPDNVWVGVSVNCKKDLWRIEELRKINAAHKFVSFEPLYGDLGPHVDLYRIGWIIIGAQTRPEIQPNEHWIADLIALADGLHIPVFLKDNLKYPFQSREFPEFVMAEKEVGDD